MNKDSIIYFSKSNLADPDDISIVRKALINNFIKVLSFQGGSYNTSNLDKSDKLFVLSYPGSVISYPEKVEILIGKGIHSEIEYSIHNGKECYIVYMVNKNVIKYSKIEFNNITIHTKDYSTEWASILIYGGESLHVNGDKLETPNAKISELKFSGLTILKKLRNESIKS